jgi:hypothetical protein
MSETRAFCVGRSQHRNGRKFNAWGAATAIVSDFKESVPTPDREISQVNTKPPADDGLYLQLHSWP